ncbi:MAG: YscO family type III secretion system apparatus protein [Rhodospirillaceae bacterium]
MTGVVAQLVQVKAWREAAAADAVRLERARLEQAIRAVEQRREELARYQNWRITREEELFDDICRRLVHVRDIEDLKHEIFQMREQDRVIEDKVKQAEKLRDATAEALDQARVVHKLAVRVVDKYREMHAILITEAKQEADRAEEIELEDFKARDSLSDAGDAGDTGDDGGEVDYGSSAHG